MDWDEFREQEENEYFLEFLKRSQETHETDVIDEHERHFDRIPTMPNVPDPMTAHPSYKSHEVNFVRSLGRRQVFLMRSSLGSLRCEGFSSDGEKPVESVGIRKYVLTSKRCFGPMPFVGDPLWEQAAYFWEVWVDEETGRHIAGDSHVEWNHIHPGTAPKGRDHYRKMKREQDAD